MTNERNNSDPVSTSGPTRRVAIPMMGKMVFRTFHGKRFVSDLNNKGLEPVHLTRERYCSMGMKGVRYVPFETNEDCGRIEKSILRPFRRFVTPTETAGLRFRDFLYQSLYGDHGLTPWLRYAVFLQVLRSCRFLAPISVSLSRYLWKENENIANLPKQEQIDVLLVGGIGNFGFDAVNSLVYTAQKRDINVVAGISNYDNLSNRGYRGFTPDKTAVWSKLMADELIRLNDIPADTVEVVGSVQFDRYFQQLTVSREQFLTSRGLDPYAKTILYAGGTNTLSLLYFFRLLSQRYMRNKAEPFNLIIRPHPDERILFSPAIWAVESVAKDLQGKCYISNSSKFSSDTINADEDLDELHCLLRYSDVIINHYSTIGLEAALCDLPTIYINYEPCSHGYYYSSTNEWQTRMTHNRRAKRLQAASIVRSDEEVFSAINKYIHNKTIHRDERREYALSECEFMDGKSGERLVSLLASLKHSI